MYGKQLTVVLGAILASLTLSACDLEIPDENNPGLDQLENTPTVASVNTATTGLLFGFRIGKATTAGYVNQLGILGREAYDFDTADSRFVTELLQSTLSETSPFGGAFWLGPYANIRQANIILRGIDKVAEYTDPQRAGIKGFAHTIIALELLTVIVTHDETGAVVDTDRPLGSELGPFVSKADVYAKIAELLDQAKDELLAAGAAFSFPLSPGFAGFNTPPNFLRFNRAIRVRVAAYTKNYAAALSNLPESFINDNPTSMGFSFATAASHSYSTGTGDQVNGLINQAIFAHPTLQTDAQMQLDGTKDARFVAKIDFVRKDPTKPVDTGENKPTEVGYPTDSSLKTTLKFKKYTNSTSIPVISNEDLILLKAEAQWFTGAKAEALVTLNIVRTGSGKLPPLADDPLTLTDTQFVDRLLYERRYSLLFEGGHRWIDLRRFGRELPLDSPTHLRNVRYPIPQQECDARSNEPACELTSAN